MIECTDFGGVGHRIGRFMGAFHRNLLKLGFNQVCWHQDQAKKRVNYEYCSGELSQYGSSD